MPRTPKFEKARPPLMYPNPAGRLHRVLDPLRQLKGNTDIKNVTYIFGASEDQRELTKAIRLVWDEFEALEEAVEEFREKSTVYDLFRNDLPVIHGAIASLGVSKTHFNSNVDDASVTALRYIGAQLEQEAQPGEETIKSLYRSIFELNEQIDKCADLNDRIRRFLRDLLRAMVDGLLAFENRGPNGLKQELCRVIGAMVMHQDYVAEVKRSSGVWTVLIAALDVMSNIVTVWESTGLSLKHAVKFITGPDETRTDAPN